MSRVDQGEGRPTAEVVAGAKNGAKRRTVLRVGTGLVIVAAADQIGGAIRGATMRDDPVVYVWPQPESRATLIAAPGAGNSGYHMGKLLSYALGNRASVVSVDYAQTNVDPAQITGAVKDALGSLDPKQRQRVGHYWLSNGGVIMTPVAHEIGEQAELALLDSAPLTKDDLRGFNGVAARMPQPLTRSRLLNLVFGAVKNGQIPPAAEDKGDWVPVDLADAHREATIEADIITVASQVEALGRHIMPDTLAGFATAAFFMTCPGGPDSLAPGTDPMVITENAYPGWNEVFGGNMQLYVDPHRSANSHGVGPIYPGGIMHQVEEYLQ